MTRPTKLVIDCANKTQQEIELTDEEISQLEADRQAAEVRKAEEESAKAAKAATKAAVLERLGLTEEEANALLA
jgi:predicted neutral ceramidase superfamily lipid hydrolase